METYFFKLLKNDGAVLAVHSSAPCGMKAVWSEVAALARCPDMTGGRIVVTNQTGEVVILIGAATARSFPIAPEAACVHAA